MEIGFFFWPYTPELVGRMGSAAARHAYDVVGIADTPGNAMDPWVAAAALSSSSGPTALALCVTNLVSRHPAVSAAAAASLRALSGADVVLGIGAGHSGVRNLGLRPSRSTEIMIGTRQIQGLLAGDQITFADGVASLPQPDDRVRVFVAGSSPRLLQAAAAAADGVYVNFGIDAASVSCVEEWLSAGLTDAERSRASLDVWHVAPLDCSVDGDASREAIGKVLAFSAGGYILGNADPASRGVPAQFHEALRELHGRYSTRPGHADAALVRELGLFDYLHDRMAICGTPEQCLAQVKAAEAAGVRKLMLSVSLAHDPVETVELFGADVLPKLRNGAGPSVPERSSAAIG
jgi:5,10-methylenetetrahydromethanopterin reductase